LKQLQEVVGNTLEQIGVGNNFLNRTQKTWDLREKNEQMELHQTKDLLPSKGNSHQTQEIAYRMGENLCQLLI
jgi:hypothetical protein